MPSILFLCLSNICRSPLAEGAARAAFAAARLTAHLDSAGTGDWHLGRAPDPRAQAAAKSAGIDIGMLRARQLTADDFNAFDLILAADHQNLRDARAIAPPGHRARLALMLDMVPGREGAALADPYYGGEEDFADCLADVQAIAAALVATYPQIVR
jgi:protein-tyrosine phosphatase